MKTRIQIIALFIGTGIALSLMAQLPKPGGTGGGGAGGGNATTTGAYGSNPATCTDGDVRFPSDSFFLLRCATNTWVPFGPFFPLTAVPALSNWAWINQGSSTAVDSVGGIYMVPQATGTTNFRILKKATPATPYTFTASFLSSGSTSAGNGRCPGLLLRESGTGKIMSVSYGPGIGVVSSDRWTNATTYAATDGSSPANGSTQSIAPRFLRISNDNTNIVTKISWDGQNWVQLASVGKTTAFTTAPDEVGWGCEPEGSATTNPLTLISWKQE